MSGKSADPFDLFLFLWSKRKLILWVTAAGAVAGLIASFVITPLFKSEVIMFPAITNTASKSVLSEYAGGRDDIVAFGDEEDSEQLIQVLNSDKIRDRVADHFDLMAVYDVDPRSEQRKTELADAFREHVAFERTKFSSVRIEVLDPDPIRAADMANYMADLVDTVWTEMIQERAGKGIRMVERNLLEVEGKIRQINDSMQVLRELGVHDYASQAERYSEYIGAAILKGDQRAVRELEDRLKVLAKYGGQYMALDGLLEEETGRLSKLRMKLEHAQADIENDLPHKFVVSAAQPADRKHSPVRSLVVMMSVISAFLLSLLLIVVQANIHKFNKRDVQ